MNSVLVSALVSILSSGRSPLIPLAMLVKTGIIPIVLNGQTVFTRPLRKIRLWQRPWQDQ